MRHICTKNFIQLCTKEPIPEPKNQLFPIINLIGNTNLFLWNNQKLVFSFFSCIFVLFAHHLFTNNMYIICVYYFIICMHILFYYPLGAAVVVTEQPVTPVSIEVIFL
jgi:hypothetical protein